MAERDLKETLLELAKGGTQQGSIQQMDSTTTITRIDYNIKVETQSDREKEQLAQEEAYERMVKREFREDMTRATIIIVVLGLCIFGIIYMAFLR
jgi:hypothetical protein